MVVLRPVRLGMQVRGAWLSGHTGCKWFEVNNGISRPRAGQFPLRLKKQPVPDRLETVRTAVLSPFGAAGQTASLWPRSCSRAFLEKK